MSNTISLQKILELANPVLTPPWRCAGAITPEKINTLVLKNLTIPHQLTELQQQKAINHMKRIAYFIKNGWDDDISVDVGVPSLGCVPRWAIEDGNHRLYAAAIRGDQHIQVSISGSIQHAAFLFGITQKQLITENTKTLQKPSTIKKRRP